jgi:hypothetical protein
MYSETIASSESDIFDVILHSTPCARCRSQMKADRRIDDKGGVQFADQISCNSVHQIDNTDSGFLNSSPDKYDIFIFIFIFIFILTSV